MIQEQEVFRLSRGEFKLLHLDQARIPMYQGRALGWGGGLAGIQTKC